MPSTEKMNVNGIELEVLRHGQGAPVVLLHGMDTVSAKAPFLDLLGRHVEVIAPSGPGFGSNCKRPADFDTIYDLAPSVPGPARSASSTRKSP